MRSVLYRVVPFAAVIVLGLFVATTEVGGQVVRPRTRARIQAPVLKTRPIKLGPGLNVAPTALRGVRQLACAGCPDLVIQEIQVVCSVDSLATEATATVEACAGGYTENIFIGARAVLRNVGGGTARFEQGQRVWSSTKTPGFGAQVALGQTETAPLGGIEIPGGTEVVSPAYLIPGVRMYKLEAGTHTFSFTVDPDNLVRETDERNVFGGVSIEVLDTPHPDIVLSGVSVSPTSGDESTQFVFRGTVRNIGAADATGRFYLSCPENAMPIYHTPDGSDDTVSPGGVLILGPSEPRTFSRGTTAVNCKTWFNAAPGTASEETTLSTDPVVLNNRATASFTVYGSQ